MDLVPKISRQNIHKCIFNNNNVHTIEAKKNIALNYVLNIFIIKQDDVELQNSIKDITRCLTTSFFNRYLYIYFLFIHLIVI